MKNICVSFLMILLTLSLFAQNTSNEIEILLTLDAITYGQAARIALDASETLITYSHEEAFLYAQDRKWLPKNVSFEDEARLDKISKLLMHSFELKGGIFYSITKAAHYAYRELVYKGIIQTETTPAMKISGDLFLFMVGRLLSEAERKVITVIDEPPPVFDDTPFILEEPIEVTERQQALVEEITAIIEEHDIVDTSVQATTEGVTITLSNIQFLADSTHLPESERKKLSSLAIILRNQRGTKLLIAGHTAQSGNEENRNRISYERAREVANYLILIGACRPSDITVTGYGASRPIADNDTVEGMAANRRVEITILE